MTLLQRNISPTEAFIEALLDVQRKQEAVDAITFADLTDPGNSYERRHCELLNAVDALRPLAGEAGFKLHAIREALCHE